MTVAFFKDRTGMWWFRAKPAWVRGYRIATLYALGVDFPG